MFIRQVKKQNSKAGKVFYQYCLVQAARLDNKVVQTILLYLGSHPLLDDKVSREQILVSLKALIFNHPDHEKPPALHRSAVLHTERLFTNQHPRTLCVDEGW